MRNAAGILCLFLTLTVGALVAQTGRGLAQSCDPCSPQPTPPYEPTAPNPPWGPGPVDLTTPNTGALSASISRINDTCSARVPSRYKIDCLRRAYLEIAAGIPNTGDYQPVRQALIDAANRLDTIVTENLDPSAETIRPREGGKPLGKRLQPVRAVAEDRLAAANEAAAKVIEDTGLLILRSGEIPKRRTAHYQQVAAAVEDNIILLRSS